MTTSHNLLFELSRCTGTENFYRHGFFRNLTYTDGVRYLAQEAQCYWLLDVIGSYIPNCIKAGDYFYCARLEKENGEDWVFTLGDEDGPLCIREEIGFSDFPLDKIKLFIAFNGDNLGWTIMLPSEY